MTNLLNQYRKIQLKYATYEIFPSHAGTNGNRSVRTTFSDGLYAGAIRDESDPVNIIQAQSEGYTGESIVWKSLVDHELLHSIVAEILFDRPSVVLRTEAGCASFWPLWERYEEEMLVLGMQIYLNSGESELIRGLDWLQAIKIANRYIGATMTKTPDQLMEEINRATSPSEMSAEEALEFLEDLASQIEASIDGLRDDLKERE